MRKTLLLFVICAVTALAGTPAKAMGALPATYYDFAFSVNAPDGGPNDGETFGHENNATDAPFDIINNSDSYDHPDHPDAGPDSYSSNDNDYQPNRHGTDTFAGNDGRGAGPGSGKGDGRDGRGSYKVVNPDRYSQITYNHDSFGRDYGQGNPYDHYFHGNEDRFCDPGFPDCTFCPVPEPSQWGWAIFLIVGGATFWRRSFRKV